MTKASLTKFDYSELKNLQRLVYLLDGIFRVPFTKYRFGIDPILGLIPGFGDMASLVVSVGVLIEIGRKGVSASLMGHMIFNVVLDATVGAIPILGNVFDFFFKSNQRNIRMYEEYLRHKYKIEIKPYTFETAAADKVEENAENKEEADAESFTEKGAEKEDLAP